MNAQSAKDANAVPIKARPTAEKTSTRRISSEDEPNMKQNQKDTKNAASPQTKGIISDVEDQAEYNGTEQSYAGYNAKENEKQFYENYPKYDDGKGNEKRLQFLFRFF